MIRTHGLLLGALLVYALSMRLLPWILRREGVNVDAGLAVYPWNFSPFPAICLFGAACFRNVRWAYALPLAAWFLGDLGIWHLTKREWGFPPGALLQYGCFLLTIALGLSLRKRRTVAAIAGTGLLAETVFFVVTNFGVWYLGDGKLYPHDSTGLLACYVAGIPFFRNSLLSMGVFSAVLFTPVMLAEKRDAAVATAE
ncbi:MAG: DUF6580 family putative transport protein [Planctomycetales bacterium]